jgi:hypothetical protein
VVSRAQWWRERCAASEPVRATPDQNAVQPPSTASACPVTKAAASEARKTTAAAQFLRPARTAQRGVHLDPPPQVLVPEVAVGSAREHRPLTRTSFEEPINDVPAMARPRAG